MRYADTGPRATDLLVIAERPEMLNAVTFALRGAGAGDFAVFSPAVLLAPGTLDPALNESPGEPGRRAAAEVAQRARLAARVVVLTDPGRDGDAFAWAASSALAGHGHVRHARVHGLDRLGMLDALARAGTVRGGVPLAGAAERLLERALNHAFFQGAASRGPDFSGRCAAALIAASRAVEPALGEAVLAMPADDGREPFTAVMPVFAGNRAAVEELVERCRDFTAAGHTVTGLSETSATGPRPWDYTDAVLHISRGIRVTPVEAAACLRRLYDAGRLSFPESDSRALSAEGIAVLAQTAATHRVRFDTANIPVFVRDGRQSAESPRPLCDDMDLGAPTLVLPHDDAALVLVTRNLLAAGQPRSLQSADPSFLPEWARRFGFQRHVSRWMRPWTVRAPECAVRMYSQEEVMLRMLRETGVRITARWIARTAETSRLALFDGAMELTPRGCRWLLDVPDPLLELDHLLATEAALASLASESRGTDTPSSAAVALLDQLGVWNSVRSRLESRESGG